ncbi:glycoside hydrolase family 97 catalytic domain-containing protein [Actinocrispum wychmicini]|uniref:Alpha-galactosidase-like protein n=1 Tax=Actinocrispum wychmicini TaxID=1213861 RepID=A0A4R2J0K5_9PSEU|nr:glycoside hydrolase family 97 catalytic domain-containing protein [Actinocrispum wychmicini]TCO50912.1 alpha-galactosidase-like protein [Actinocrispum wychmicini]
MRAPVIMVSTLVAGLVAAPANAQPIEWDHHEWGGPTATVSVKTGMASLAVTEGGHTVLAPSSLGIVTEHADLSKNLKLVRRSSRPVVEHYETKVGKATDRTAFMTESRFTFEGDVGARFDLLVRTSRDGVAYRYVLPGDTGAILRETSGFTVPAGSAAWLATYKPDYESPFVQTTSDGAAAGEYLHPALFDVGGTYLHITESDVDGRDSGAHLVHDAGTSTYRIKYFDDKVDVTGPVATAWRTMIVGDPRTVAASTLVNDLATPSKVADTSWVKPGKVFWSWLAGGREAGQSLAMQKGYVDYAATHGWPYVLVDAGWYFDPNWDYDPNWETTSWIPELVRYAQARNVKIQVWMHFGELDTEAERQSRLALLQRWGVAGVKIDFMNSDSQDRFRWYDQILPELAEHRLMVNFHGSTIPHGVQRTWPNVMTMEGVFGAEHSSGLSTADLTTLPFTRNVPGSMDYTPMAWHRPNRPTSDAHELALSVVFESGFQNFAGRVADYQARPEAERFLDQVPTVWDESRLLAGRPADSAVFARRSGDRWFIGGGFSGAARTAQVPLAIQPGLWLVDMVKDGLVREQRVMWSGTKLSVDVMKDGGFAAIACRWYPGIRTCDRPVRTIPSTTVTATPQATTTPGTAFQVTGKFTVDTEVRGVSLYPRVPAGWTVTGPTVTARSLRPGQELSGSWTLTAPATFGYVDVPVVASFDSGLEAEQVTRVHVWKPLPAGWTYLSDLPFTGQNGNGPVRRDLANAGKPIAIRRVNYGKGLGMFADAEIQFTLDARCTEFVTDVGVDDEAGLDVARQKVGGTVGFGVLGDGTSLVDTGTMGVRTPARPIDLDVAGVRTLTLKVTDGGDGTQNDHASWGDARVRCQGLTGTGEH